MRATRRPGWRRSGPCSTLLHPRNPDVVYFFLEEHLFGVDMRAKKIVECDFYELVEPPGEFVSSGFVVACELPPLLSTARGNINGKNGMLFSSCMVLYCCSFL